MAIHRTLGISVCAVSLSIVGVAVDQQILSRAVQAQQAQGQRPAGQADQRAHWRNSNQALATCMAIANQEEVAIAQFVLGKTRNTEVREFASMLVKDHQACLEKLQKFAPEATKDGYLAETDEESGGGNRPTTSNQARQGAARNVVTKAGGTTSENPKNQNSPNAIEQVGANQANQEEQGSHHIDFVQLHKEIAEECIRDTKMGLSKKNDSELDQCFVGFQIAKHAEMKSKLTVLQRYATGDLKQVVTDGIESTEKHLRRAEEIMKKLSKTNGSDQNLSRAQGDK